MEQSRKALAELVATFPYIELEECQLAIAEAETDYRRSILRYRTNYAAILQTPQLFIAV